MMKLARVVLTLMLCAILLLGGCDSEEKKPDTMPEEKTMYPEKPDTTPEEKTGDQDRTVLVWVSDSITLMQMGEDIEVAMNKALDDMNCDFAVDFIGIDPGSYTENVRAMISTGRQIDVLFTGMTIAGENARYYSYIEEGLFEPFSGFFETDMGGKLYQSIPAEQWQVLKYKGDVYGIDASAIGFNSAPSYVVNKEIMEKHGITEADISKELPELEEILEMVYSGEGKSGFSTIMKPSFDTLPGTRFLSASVYLDEYGHQPVALSVLDNEDFIEYLRILCRYSDKGYINTEVSAWRNPDNFFLFDIPYRIFPEKYIEANFADSVGNPGGVIQISYTSKYENILRETGLANGVFSGSQHKDKAFELLALTYTEPELNNLLSYGRKGIDYKLEEGRVIDTDKSYSTSSLFFGNAFINHPSLEEEIDKREVYKEVWSNTRISNYTGIFIDKLEVKDELSRADGIVTMKLDNIYEINVEEFDAFIEDLRSELEVAGMSRILQEINRQLDEWETAP